MASFKMVKSEKINLDVSLPVVKIKAVSEEFVPVFGTLESAGADLKSSMDIVLKPGKVEMVDVGFACKIPEGFHAKIVARSSMGRKGIIVPNGPGIIDSDYVLGIKVLLLNLSSEDYEIKRGDRVAQWIIEKNVEYGWQEVAELETTERVGGFGSTGK
jgi:dUTP pyrophosphatase